MIFLSGGNGGGVGGPELLYNQHLDAIKLFIFILFYIKVYINKIYINRFMIFMDSYK